MSMPAFPNPAEIPTTEQALAAIIASVAMEEVALSHVINAESEKIKFVVECAKEKGCENMNIDDILAVNKSVDEVLKRIVELQIILKKKFDTAVNFMPPIPPIPPIPPEPSCSPKFFTQPGYIWYKNSALFLMGKDQSDTDNEPCGDGIRLNRKNCESMISLPSGRKFEILFELETINKYSVSVKINVEFRIGDDVVKTERMEQDGEKIKISQTIEYETPVGGGNTTVISRLVSPESLSCIDGAITIFEK